MQRALDAGMNSASEQDSELSYCCPLCKSDLENQEQGYGCEVCQRTFPVVWGIPDFRVFPDPYIGMEEDRIKGLRLTER